MNYDYLMELQQKKELDLFLHNQKGLIAAFLFGSQAQGKATYGSDIDLALLYSLAEVPSAETILSFKQSLESKLLNDIDLIVLNTANPILKFQVFKQGHILFCQDKRELDRFIIKSLMEYDDISRIRLSIEKAIAGRRLYGRS
ncbi:MAG: DNA polymerase beta subunit [uncultured bacterium]|nr:MAG: DNA polymerase beta subunit [uncultured bacterium]